MSELDFHSAERLKLLANDMDADESMQEVSWSSGYHPPPRLLFLNQNCQSVGMD
jgi:hypothetical protein